MCAEKNDVIIWILDIEIETKISSFMQIFDHGPIT